MRYFLVSFLFLALGHPALADEIVKVGVPTVLTGDLAVMGNNLVKTIETYKKMHLRHKINFIFEDAKKSGAEGLSAYKKLIEVDKVDMLIGGTVSNGTMAGAPLVNKSETVMITPLTGGSNIDHAGEYIFRIGNSDILNAHEQADLLLAKGLRKVALFTEQTEYTQDIAHHFKKYFAEKGGELVFDEDFLPDVTSFRSTIVRLRSKSPQAVFISTQTGLAFGIFIKEFRQGTYADNIEIHTNFVAACNPDAYEAAGAALHGVKYLAPYYDSSSERLLDFLRSFKQQHGSTPAIPMHTAGTVDALDLLQKYLDRSSSYSRKGFRDFLLTEVKNYQGLMGRYSFNSEGNADLGFVPFELIVQNGKLLSQLLK